MSGKSPIFPLSIARGTRFESTTASAPEQVSTFIRQIQADAEQICTDAVDIEDARFLAADILDVCRRFVSNASVAPNGRKTVGRVKVPAPAATPESADESDAACARAKLDILSARELEIFTELAEGHSAAEIATRLSRSTKTVNNHRTRILQKLGLKNSAELVRLALKSGVVSV